MKRILGVSSLVLVTATVFAETKRESKPEQFAIEDFTFQWTVEESGEAKLRVNKTDEATTIVVQSTLNSVSMLPAEAEAVGKALDETGKLWAKMKGATQQTQEVIEAGDHSVRFLQTPGAGFRVMIAEKGGFSLSNAMLDKKQAESFGPHLKKAVAMAAYVDKVIDEAIAGE